MDRERDERRGSRRRRRARRRRVRGDGRAKGRRTGSVSSRTNRRRTTGTTTSSQIRRSGSCSTTCGDCRTRRPRSRAAQRVVQRLPARQPRVRDATVAELDRDPGAAVFFHDYHLYLAPKLVRERRPDALSRISSTFPGRRRMTDALPEHLRREVHEGSSRMTSSASTRNGGSATSSHVRGASSVAEVDHERDHRRQTTAARRSSPAIRSASIPSSSTSMRKTRVVLEQERLIVERRPEFLLVRVDRTDPSKNVVRGVPCVRALPRHASGDARQGDVARAARPVAADVPEYSEYLAAVQREARAVNDRFQHEGWVPIDLQIADNFAQSVAAYKQYDALLVNAVFDGLNLVSKEAPLAQRARRRADPLGEHRRVRRSSASGR